MFKEQESWNGTVDKTIDAQEPLIEKDDVVDKDQQESKENSQPDTHLQRVY